VARRGLPTGLRRHARSAPLLKPAHACPPAVRDVCHRLDRSAAVSPPGSSLDVFFFVFFWGWIVIRRAAPSTPGLATDHLQVIVCRSFLEVLGLERVPERVDCSARCYCVSVRLDTCGTGCSFPNVRFFFSLLTCPGVCSPRLCLAATVATEMRAQLTKGVGCARYLSAVDVGAETRWVWQFCWPRTGDGHPCSLRLGTVGPALAVPAAVRFV